MTVLYFTATGNNLYVAKRLGGEMYSIPKAMKENKYSFCDDKIGLVFPIFGLGVPAIIEKFIEKAELKSDYIFAVLSYGMFSGAAASHLAEIGGRRGIRFSYINTIQMVDNFIPNFDMEKQISGEPKKKIEDALEKIISDVGSAKAYVRRDSGLAKFMTKRFAKSGSFETRRLCEKFYLEDGCVQCGICVKVCPVDNVSMRDDKPEFGERCINCLACIHACSKNVIHYQGEKSKARFRNQHVAVKEIIEANE